MAAALIRVTGLCKQYSVGGDIATPVLHEVSFDIASGEFVAIMGPSGSGKSTLMNIIGCLDTPSSGHYFLAGRDVSMLGADELALLRGRLIGFVFQGFNLLQRMTVLDNVALPLLYAGVGRAERRAQALLLLEQVGLSRHAEHRPNQLSGGQQQRVAIARALITRPQLILADEPTGNLDTHTSEEILKIFQTLNEQQAITVVLVTHEPDIARYARRLIRIVDGCIAGDGPTDLLLAPAQP